MTTTNHPPVAVPMVPVPNGKAHSIQARYIGTIVDNLSAARARIAALEAELAAVREVIGWEDGDVIKNIGEGEYFRISKYGNRTRCTMGSVLYAELKSELARVNGENAALEARVREVESSHDKAVKSLTQYGYTDCGGELWKPPLGKRPDFDRIDRLESDLDAARVTIGELVRVSERVITAVETGEVQSDVINGRWWPAYRDMKALLARTPA